MRSRWSIAVLVFLALAGCSDSTASKHPSLDGEWVGMLGVASFEFTLTETRGDVSGNGVLMAGQTTLELGVSGSHAHPDVIMTVAATGYEPTEFVGRFVGEDEIVGTLNGSGFEDTEFLLIRQ